MEKKLMFKAEQMNKKYPGTHALKDVSIEINEGEVIGLIGENGAGKSTLLNIIMGVESPTSGQMWIHGKEYAPKTPKEANEQGVGMVFQEQSVITNLTVGQNIFFGKEKDYRKFGLIQWKKMYSDTQTVLDEMDLKVKPQKKVVELNFAIRQMVEIAKVLNQAKSGQSDKSLILLDEPTSVLNDEDIKQLFTEINKLKQKGNSVIFISHRLDEVIKISDRIYVFKDGKNVGIVNKEDAEESILYEKMVGRTSSGEYYKIANQTVPTRKSVLEVKELALRGRFKDINFNLHEGEVIGICGVVGSGKEDLCSVIAGDDQATAGQILLEGQEVMFNTPYDALMGGIIAIPKERRKEGILSILSIFENISISSLNQVRGNGLCVGNKKIGLISKKKQIQQSKEWIKTLNIKCADYSEEVGQLSGGNAQKVVFSRVLASQSKILILNHPTRGVDVGAKEEIYSLIRSITKKGLAVILLGDTLDECIGLSSKILVMKDGLITREFDAPVDDKPKETEIIKYMM